MISVILVHYVNDVVNLVKGFERSHDCRFQEITTSMPTCSEKKKNEEFTLKVDHESKQKHSLEAKYFLIA